MADIFITEKDEEEFDEVTHSHHQLQSVYLVLIHMKRFNWLTTQHSLRTSHLLLRMFKCILISASQFREELYFHFSEMSVAKSKCMDESHFLIRCRRLRSYNSDDLNRINLTIVD